MNISPYIIQSYKKADQVGLPFEGKGMWLDVPEWRIQLALKSSQGSDESSIVDCFLAYVERYFWNADMDLWLWGWLTYHQQHHGRGYLNIALALLKTFPARDVRRETPGESGWNLF